MIDAQQMQLIKAQVSLRIVPPPIPKKTPPLINAQGLEGVKESSVYGDAGMLSSSGKVNRFLHGDASKKSGIVNSGLWGDWTDIIGIIDSSLIGCCTATSGRADGKKGNISGVYGLGFGNWIGDMSGLSGYLYEDIGGDATGITATTDEIREALKGDGNQVP